jgi:DNA repair exonuclease SbcCD ATPase subunit
MIIEKIHIISFGKLSDFTLELAEGVNIIEGKNESGKSTVSAFIKFMFYGLSAEPDERARSISWQSATAAGTLTVRDREERYRIEREAVPVRSGDGKTSYRERCAVYSEETGKPLYKGKVPGEIFFGIPRGVFESTAFIGQLEGSQAGGRTLAEATENILFSADETVNTKKALKKLDEARVFLYHKNRKGGKIYEYSRERAELAEKLTKAQETSSAIINLESSLHAFEESRKKTEQTLAGTEHELAAYERYLIQQNYIKLQDELEKSENAGKELASIARERYGAGMTDEKFLRLLENARYELIGRETEMKNSAKALAAAEEKVRKLKADFAAKSLEHAGEDHTELLAREEKGRKKAALMQKLLIISAVLAAAGTVGAVFLLPLIAIALAGAAGTAVFAVQLAGAKKAAKDVYAMLGTKNYADFLAALALLQKEEAELTFALGEEKAAKRKAEEAELALTVKRAETEEMLLRADFEVSESLLADIAAAEAEVRAAGEKRRRLALEKNASDAKAAEISALLDAIPADERERAIAEDFDEEAMQAFDMRAKKREQDFLLKSIAAQKDKIHEIECELASLTALRANPAEIAQEINAIGAKIDEFSEKFDAYMLAIDAINAASCKLRDGISPKIAQDASEIMGELSAGKYPSVFVDSDFALSYSSGGITRDIATLSAGSADIAYISLRIALAKTLCKHSLPPFVFDESFTRLDSTRLSAALELLEKTFTKNSQALIFTCHEREKLLANDTVLVSSLSN